MKRIFISVGSEALKALTSLVGRLNEEGIFNQFNDTYIAIDTDQAVVSSFQKLQALYHTDRIRGTVLKIYPEKDNKVGKTYQPEWPWESIPPGGVGGNRAISAKAVAAIKDIWDPLNETLAPTDEIIVMGSAFGGTSGGLFLNLCEYLDLQIRNRRAKNEEYKNVSVLGFLLMPEAVDEGDGHGYCIALNMLDMFRDLQTISWQRRLESGRKGFKVPVWSQVNKDGASFPLFGAASREGSKLEEYGIAGSTLPMGTLYLIPTPQRQRHLVNAYFAESVLAATYLHIDRGHAVWIDRAMQGGVGVVNEFNVDDRCLAGFNMFVMKSGRRGSLRKWFNDRISVAIEGANNRGGLLSNAENDVEIRRSITKVFSDILIKDREKEFSGVKDCEAVEKLLNEITSLGNLPSLEDFYKRIDELMGALDDGVQNFEVYSGQIMISALSAKELRVLHKGINFAQIKNAYTDLYNEIIIEAESVDAYKEQIVKTTKSAIKKLHTRLKSRVVKDTFLGLGIEEEITREVLSAFKDRIKELLNYYLFALRCKKSVFITPATFGIEVEEFKTKCRELDAKCKAASANNEKENPFIVGGKIVDLKLSNEEDFFFPVRIILQSLFRPKGSNEMQNLIKILNDTFSDPAEIIAAMRDGDKNVFDKVEEESIQLFIDECQKLHPTMNPLKDATLRSFNREVEKNCKSFSESFRLPDSGSMHYHFSIQCGDVPYDFGLKNMHVKDAPLNLRTMPNCEDLNANFLDVDHSGTSDPRSWQDNKSPDLFLGSAVAPDVQGLWLGTLGIDFEVKDILNKIYATYGQIKSQWVRVGSNARQPRHVMTTVEMVRFGLIIEAIEEVAQKMWRKHLESNKGLSIVNCNNKVQVTFNGNGSSFSLPCNNFDLNNLGFGQQDGDNTLLQMEKITVPWVGAIFDWIRKSGDDGFVRMVGIEEAKFTSIETAQTDIFNAVRFRIENEEIEAMDKVKEKLVSMCEISLLES